MTTLGSRIKEALAQRDMSLKDLAKAVGVSYETIRKWVTDETAPNRSRMAVLCTVLGLTEQQLRFGAGSVPEQRSATQAGSGLVIPVFDAPASMGTGYAQPDHDVIIGGIHVEESWIRKNLGSISSPKNLAVIPAYGDSMTPTFADSDLLLVDRGVGDIKLDAVYVLSLKGELYIKRIQRHPNGSILMIPDNNKYQVITVENGDRDQFSVLGRVVWAWVGRKL